MKHYDFAEGFRGLYLKAIEQYGNGVRSADALYDAADKAWLAVNGINSQHMFDYAEDEANYGEPGFARALTIEQVRRNYFVNVQQGRPAKQMLDETKMPAKADEVRGIAWLPRLMPKSRAKLRGELPASLMYCCGGDRKFFKEHDIDPAEFLSLVWRNENNDGAIIDWVVARKRM